MNVSVVIPFRDRFDLLERALVSVREQTVSVEEVFLVDDFSDDQPNELLASFEDLPIVYHRFSEHRNANVARNWGIEHSSSEYIALLDSDDEWDPDHLEKATSFLYENNILGCYGGIRIIEHGKDPRKHIPRAKEAEENGLHYLLKGGLCSSPTMVFRKELWQGNAFDEQLDRHQDLDFAIQVFESGKSFVCTQLATVKVHWTEPSPRKINIPAIKVFYTKHERLFTQELSFIFYRNLYHAAKVIPGVPQESTDYLRLQTKEFSKGLGLTSFMSIDPPENVFSKLWSRLRYLAIKFAS